VLDEPQVRGATVPSSAQGLARGIVATGPDSSLLSAPSILDDVPRPVMTTATIICSSGPKSLLLSDILKFEK